MSGPAEVLKGRYMARLVCGFMLAGALGTGVASEPDIQPWQSLDPPIAAHQRPGTWTLVMFWSVTCGICAAETPALSAFYERERESGIELLGVSIDGASMRHQVARWMTQHQMRFPTLLGDLAEIGGYFARATREPFRGTPTFMLFDPTGQVVGVNAGPVRPEAVKSFIDRKRSAD